MRERQHEAMARLVAVIQELSLARTLEGIMKIVRHAARELSGADGATFVLRDNDMCYYADEEAISPLWKGQRFPMSACISGWTMLNRQPAVIPDIYQDARIPIDAYRPTFVRSLVMVPIRASDPVGAIGTYWACEHVPPEYELEVLQSLANTTAVAIENVQLYAGLEQRVRQRTHELQMANEELQAFSYSVSHDLRAPLRHIGGYAKMLRQELKAPLSSETIRFLDTIDASIRQASNVIDDLLKLSQIAAIRLERKDVDLSAMAAEILDSLRRHDPEREAEFIVEPGLMVEGDSGLLRVALNNLLGNAWKYSKGRPVTRIQVGRTDANGAELFVRDEGAGFDMGLAVNLFKPFYRMHNQQEFPGTGIGLATVLRIISRHGGSIRAEAALGRGATFFFTIPSAQNPPDGLLNSH